MNIVLIFTYDMSLRKWAESGLLDREIKLYKTLAKNGVQVSFVTYGDDLDYEYAKELDGIQIFPYYSYLKQPKGKTLRLFYSLRMPFVLRSVFKGADIVKSNQMWGSWVAVLSKLLFRKALILRTGYELYDAARFRNSSIIYMSLIRIISWISYRSSTLVHVATSENKEVVQDVFGINSDKIKIMPNWVDTDTFCNKIFTRIKDTVLFVGRLHEQKNIPLLLHALSGTDIGVDIVGAGGMREELQELSERLAVPCNFLGSIPNDQMPDIYNQYSIYVLCSPYEGNPKTLLEAMSCGCAVIGTNVLGIRGLIAHEKNGLLVAEDSQSLRHAILRLNKDLLFSASLGEEASRNIKKHNSLERLIVDEIQSYRQCLK